MSPDELKYLVDGYISLTEEIQGCENDDDHVTVVNQALYRHVDAIQTVRDREEFTKELVAVKAERLTTSIGLMIGEEVNQGKLEKLRILFEEARDLQSIARYGV